MLACKFARIGVQEDFRETMKPYIRTYLCNDENKRFFGEGPLRLLHAIEETGSLRCAALSMNMAYTKALRIVRDAEAALEFPLTVRTTGGKGGGGSQLTIEAKEFLTKYEMYHSASEKNSIKLYEKIFNGQQIDSASPKIACIIMASGLGKRFGSNKLMASFHGNPIIRSILDATADVTLFAERLVVTRSQDVHDYCKSLNVPVLLHAFPNRNEALALGLSHLQKKHPDLSGCLFALGDQPLLRPETLTRMCKRYIECKITQNHPEYSQPIIQLCSIKTDFSSETAISATAGSPIIFDYAYFDELLHLPEKSGGSTVLRRYPEHIQYVTAAVPEELMDVDTPDELKQLENIIHN